MDNLVEAEVKIEISNSEFTRLKTDGSLEKLGFTFSGEEHIVDTYISYEKSPYGGWDFIRLRKTNNIFFQTRKYWEKDKEGSKVRFEEEEEINEDSYIKNLSTGYVLQFEKIRHNYAGTVENNKAHFSIDILKLSDQERYFFEGEVLTTPDESKKIRAAICSIWWNKLNLEQRNEAPSMLEIFGHVLK